MPEFALLTGDSVEVSGAPADALEPTTHATWSVGGVAQHFASGNRNFGEFFAASLGVSGFDKAFGYQEGDLKLGSDSYVVPRTGTEVLRRWAVWAGPSHSLCIHAVSSPESEAAVTEQLLALLDAFEIDDTPTGIVLSPVRDDVKALTQTSYAPGLYQTIPTLGLIDVRQLTVEHTTLLPATGGLRTEKGMDLYLQDNRVLDDGRLQPIVWVVSPTAVGVVEVDPGLDDALALENVSRLAFAWNAK